MKKLAVVTGARRGIGLAIAKKLSEMGYALLICATSPEAHAALEAVPGAEYMPCDISDPAARAALFERVRGYGRLDVLVNNAGVAPLVRMDILTTTPEIV